MSQPGEKKRKIAFLNPNFKKQRKQMLEFFSKKTGKTFNL